MQPFCTRLEQRLDMKNSRNQFLAIKMMKR